MPKTPLFVVTGASCVGKSSVVPYLRSLLPDFDVFDLHPEEESSYSPLSLDHLLQVAYQVSLSERGTILVGTLTPETIQESDYRDRFSQIYYINLHCSDDVREHRLREKGASEAVIRENMQLAHQLLQNEHTLFNPPVTTMDTTSLSLDEVGKLIRKWVNNYWSFRYPLEIRA
ncbi:AAA family ATPase [Neobacillus mesonae]|nr:AAA family ATPase [Neobacillus mesonae]